MNEWKDEAHNITVEDFKEIELYLYGGRGSGKTTLQRKAIRETIKCLETIIEYEQNCELKYDRGFKSSLPIPEGERLIDFAVKNKVEDFEELERLYQKYELKEAMVIMAKLKKEIK